MMFGPYSICCSFISVRMQANSRMRRLFGLGLVSQCLHQGRYLRFFIHFQLKNAVFFLAFQVETTHFQVNPEKRRLKRQAIQSMKNLIEIIGLQISGTSKQLKFQNCAISGHLELYQIAQSAHYNQNQMNQKQIEHTASLRKLKLTLAGSKTFHKKQISISTQTNSPEQLLDAEKLNGIVQKEVGKFKLSEKEQVPAHAQEWSIMKEEGKRLADMGMHGQGQILSTIQGGPVSSLFHQQFQVSIKRWLLPSQQVLKVDQNRQTSFFRNQQDLFINKSEAIKYRSPYSYWFSCQHNKTYCNKPRLSGIIVSTKNQ